MTIHRHTSAQLKYPAKLPCTPTCKPSGLQQWPVFSIHFYLRSPNATLTPVYAIVRLHKTLLKFSTTLKVNPLHWDKKKQSCILSHSLTPVQQKNYAIANELIATLTTRYTRFFNHLRSSLSDFSNIDSGTISHALAIKNSTIHHTASPAPDTDIRLEALKLINTKRASTARQYTYILSHFLSFLSIHKIPHTLASLSYTTLYNYCEALIAAGRSYSNIKSSLGLIKTILRHFSSNPNIPYTCDPRINEIDIPRTYDTRTPCEKAAKHLVLTPAQLQLFASAPLSGNEAIARDMFLLQCYCGVRHSDIPKLVNPQNYKEVDGKPYSIFEDRKEGHRKQELVKAPLWIHPCVKPIWLRFSKGTTPILCLSTYNRILKRIAARFDEFSHTIQFRDSNNATVTKPLHTIVSSQDGRHTLVSYCANTLGLTPEEIIAYTGHASTLCLHSTYMHLNIEGQLRRLSRVTSKALRNTLSSQPGTT